MGILKNRGKTVRHQILDFVIAFSKENGYAPSYRDIMRECDIASTSVVSYHLDILEEQGLITRKDNLSRTLKVVED